MSLSFSQWILHETSLPRQWFHGTSLEKASEIKAIGFIKPGMPSVYRHDIPNPHAVHITSDRGIAQEYATENGRHGEVLEVIVSDPQKLTPDEDVVWQALQDWRYPTKMLSAAIRRIWFDVQNENEPKAYKTFRGLHKSYSKNLDLNDPSPSGDMISLASIIVDRDRRLADQIISVSRKAAHLGPVKVKP
jgi:hypothetical protein